MLSPLACVPPRPRSCPGQGRGILHVSQSIVRHWQSWGPFVPTGARLVRLAGCEHSLSWHVRALRAMALPYHLAEFSAHSVWALAGADLRRAIGCLLGRKKKTSLRLPGPPRVNRCGACSCVACGHFVTRWKREQGSGGGGRAGDGRPSLWEPSSLPSSQQGACDSFPDPIPHTEGPSALPTAATPLCEH